MRSRFKIIENKPKISNSNNLKGEFELNNIRKRKDNRWEFRKTINGQNFSIIKKTQKELLKEIKAFNLRLKNKNLEKIPEYTLKTWFYFWAETYKKNKIKEKSYNDILTKFRNYIEPLSIANIELKYLTSDLLQKALNKIERSRKKEIATLYLKACLEKAYKTGKIKQNIFEEVVTDKKINNIGIPFTYEEQEKILNEIKNTDIEHSIMFYLITGIRENELPNKEELKRNLDTTNNLLKIECEKKRNAEPIYRYIDLSENGKRYIIDNIDKITQYTPTTIYKKFKQVLNNLQIEGHIHKLRHTFTTNCFYLRNPDKLISSWLGHTTVELTRKVYISIDRSITKEKIEKLYNNLYYKFDPNFDPKF